MSLLHFLHDENSDSINLNLLNHAIYSRQKILKEQGFIKRFVDILDACFPTVESLRRLRILEESGIKKRGPKLFKVGRRTLWQDFQAKYEIENIRGGKNISKQRNQVKILAYLSQICSLIFEVLKSIARDNHQNEEECFNYIEIFKKQSGYELGATACIISIIEKNEKLLLNLCKHSEADKQENLSLTEEIKMFEMLQEDSTIHHFVREFKSASPSYHRDILKFLSAACKFEDQGITVNQTLIHSLVIQDQVVRNNTLLKIHCGPDNKITIEVPEFNQAVRPYSIIRIVLFILVITRKKRYSACKRQ